MQNYRNFQDYVSKLILSYEGIISNLKHADFHERHQFREEGECRKPSHRLL